MLVPGSLNISRRFALIVLGIVALFGGLVYSASFPPLPQSDVPAGLDPVAGTSAFVEEFAQATGSQVGQGAPTSLINSGTQFEQELVSDINAASSSIDMTTFPWEDGGVFSPAVFNAAIAAVRRGVNVRILLDGFGSSVSGITVNSLRNAGVDIAYYHTFSVLDPLQYDDRDHMRAFVIDDKVGFLGGMGIADDWLGTNTTPEWQDMMFGVSGVAAQAVDVSFAQLWYNATGQQLQVTAPASMTPSSSGPEFVEVTSIPPQSIDPIYDAFVLTALSAQKTLYIVNPFILPDPAFLSILEQKARDGVDVRIISPGPITSGPLLRYAWHAQYQALLNAGVKLYEYQPVMIHTKFMVADDTWSLIGSANLDNRSAVLNAENVMGVEDPAFAQALTAQFMQYQSQSVQITAASWAKQYGPLQQFISRLALIFTKQY